MMIEHDDLRGVVSEPPQLLVLGRDVDEHDETADVCARSEHVVVPARHIAGIVAPGAPHRPRRAEAVGAARVEIARAIHPASVARTALRAERWAPSGGHRAVGIERTSCDTVRGSSHPVPAPPRHTACAALPLPAGLDPPSVLERLRSAAAPWLLESPPGVSPAARFSFAGADPYLVLRSRGLDVEVQCRRAVYEGLETGVERERAPALEALRRRLPRPPQGGVPVPFCGGAVGFFGYELAEQLDALRLRGDDDLGLPDALWLLVDALVAFDHAEERAWICGLGFAGAEATASRRADAAARRLARQLARAGRSAARARSAPFAQRRAARAPPRQARAASSTSAPITRRSRRPPTRSPRAVSTRPASPTGSSARSPATRGALYRALRRLNPAPFAAFFELPELAIVGSSPERFLRVGADGRVESRPIKGTRPRGADPAERRARARRALARLREGPRREPDDRRPRAQRSGPRLRDRQRRGARALRGRAVRVGVPARVDGDAAACAAAATRSTRVARGLPARLDDRRAEARGDAAARPARAACGAASTPARSATSTCAAAPTSRW